MSIRRFVAAGVGLSLLVPVLGSGTAGAARTPNPVVPKAVDWLETQQQADGGFEVGGFPGFEGPDATFALAQASQTDGFWDQAAARAAVQAVETSGGKDPLDAIDDLVDDVDDPTSDLAAAQAAKVISIVAVPLQLSTADFDPSNDSASAVDLVERLTSHQQPDGSYSLGAYFNGVLYTPIALDSLGQAVPAGLVTQIVNGQRSDGSWDYTGAATGGPGNDVDTTSLAINALRSAGKTAADPTVAKAISFLAAHQQASGAWQAFGADDPNSTATALLALSDVHIDASTSGWRAAAGSPVTGTYVSPYTWLANQQAADGHIASGNDTFGVNTFATSQGVQALSQQWYLNDEFERLISRWSIDLASPLAASDGGRIDQLGTDALGPNPSIKAKRLATTTAALGSLAGRQAAAADLFQQAFHRTIDPSGKAYWSNKLSTISRPEMLSRLTGSSEYYRKAGGTIPTFVDAVYQSVLGRAGDPSGRAYWIGRLQAGRSVESVARSLVASTEYRRHQVNDAFGRLLQRVPTTGERDYWIAKIATTRIEVLLAGLAASAEYYELAPA